MRIVDAHTHLGLESFIVRPISEEKRKKPAFKDRMEQETATLLAALDRNRVDAAVAFPFPLSEVDADWANAYLFSAAQTKPGRIIPFALLGDDFASWIACGARGFKQHFLLEPERFDLARIYPAIAEAGLPLIAHLPTRAIVAAAEAILKMAPSLKLIIAHMGRCEPNTGLCVPENLRALAGHENVYFETSTVRDAATFALAVDLVGPGRILFGSDLPFNSHLGGDPLAAELELMRGSGIPADALEGILGGNLLALVGGLE
ncbi:MAG: amidohydrolase family protein [Spirochaetota bacterium]